MEDVAGRAHIDVVNVNGGTTAKRYILEATGSGVAVLDYDRDGWPDIFLVNGTELKAGRSGAQRKSDGGKKKFLGTPGEDLKKEISEGAQSTGHLFHNNRDGTFSDVTAAAGLTASGWGQGVCAGDYDNDGFDDLYITYYGRNRLYHNDGRGHFTEVAQGAGVAGSGREWGTGCAFVDYDRDGRLDIAVANYVHFDLEATPPPGQGLSCLWKGVPVMCGPRGLPSAPNVLYHNLGDGKFADVSKSSGFEATNGHYCFSVSTLDYDDDGWPDIYVACDSTPSILYHNNHDGTFTDRAPEAGAAFDEDGREQAGMGSSVGDYDGDGRADIFKTNFSDDTSTLYRNNGDGSFTDVTYPSGLAVHTEMLGWGAMFVDIDNDGWPDILTVNGHVYPEVDSANLGAKYRESRLLYRNLGNGKFQDITQQAGPGITEPQPGRGLAIADLWNDGRQEAIINNISDRPQLLVNLAPNRNHWIGIRLIGTLSNRDGIGARVTVRAGGRSFSNEVRSGSSYDSSSDLRLHFGLGMEGRIENITVRWPNGTHESFDRHEIDAAITLTEGTGVRMPATGPGPASSK